MKILRQILGDISKKEGFVYVSIGANDGIFVDEIYQQNLLQANWKSYFVEPVKETFDKLVSNYTRLYPNNNFTYENSAIYVDDGSGELVTVKNDDSNGLCSFFRKYADAHTVVHKVTTIKFKTFLERYSILDISFLKVDCEGMDAEIVLQCFDNEIYPDIILFEDIEGALANISEKSNIRLTSGLIPMALSLGYIQVNDHPEFQYESHNKLLVKQSLLKSYV